MGKKAALAAVRKFCNRIEARGIRLKKVILYGSYATNTHTIASDIDLVVISDDFADKGHWERIDILSEVIYEIFAPLEVVAFTSKEWARGNSFFRKYAKNGKVLYAA